MTPLEKAVGMKVAENTYDLLCFEEQVIVDLRIENWDRQDIATLFAVAPETVTYWMRRIRYKLAKSQLIFNMEMKEHYREQQRASFGEVTHKNNDE